MNTSKKIIVGVVVVAAAAAVMLPRFLKPKETFDAAVPPTITWENPEVGSIELTRGLIGNVEPSDMVTITPKMAGEVKELNIKPGDYVTEGQVLCVIDTKQVDGAKITMNTAAVNLQDAKTNLARMEVLYQSGDISQQSYEQLVNSVKLAQLQYEGAKLAYDTQLEYSTITAPISGIVESCGIELRQTVSQQNLICVISGEGSKAVSFSVTESVVGNLKVGDTINIEKSGTQYQGKITEVSTMIDATTGLFKVKAAVDQADALPTGSAVKLYVISDKAANVLTIPVDAVYYENGSPFVYSYADGASHKTSIETGIYDSSRMEIKSGLTLEDKVITTWSSELYEGALVTENSNDGQSMPAETAEGETENTDQKDNQ